MRATELTEWRKRNRYTQEQLSMALDVKRQTVSGWENSNERLPITLALSLIALEHQRDLCAKVEGCTLPAGTRMAMYEAREIRLRPHSPGSRAARLTARRGADGK